MNQRNSLLFGCFFRRDSDIFSPYGYNKDILNKDRLRISPEDFQVRFQEIIEKKKGVVLWTVSNCGDRWSPALGQRLRVSQDLIDAGLYIERKGLCFGGRDDSYKPVDYKFYLSFENQLHCKDYITEKLWKNAYDNDAVPIVWGATKADYEAAAPPNSFIFAEDFTPQELADYIHYLDKNDTAYAEYFKWRTLRPQDMSMYGRECWFCQICRILHGVNVDNIYNPNYESKYKDIPLLGYPERPRVVPSLSERFYGTENEDCIADQPNLKSVLLKLNKRNGVGSSLNRTPYNLIMYTIAILGELCTDQDRFILPKDMIIAYSYVDKRFDFH